MPTALRPEANLTWGHVRHQVDRATPDLDIYMYVYGSQGVGLDWTQGGN